MKASSESVEVTVATEFARDMLKDFVHALEGLRTGLVTKEYVITIYEHWMRRLLTEFPDDGDHGEPATGTKGGAN